MCDLNWCPVCDKAISCESDSLYCSMNCFAKDANSHINHNFQSFLTPKTCSITYNNNLSLMDNLPELSNSSLYTDSTFSSISSSSSIFTRRAALLARKQQQEEEEDEEEKLACCDYCENLNKKKFSISLSSSSSSQPRQIFIPPIISTTTLIK